MANQIFVILCGGTGPRLWPLSTTSHPKQFLPILSQDSLLEQTIKRLLKVTDSKKIFITTSNRNIDQINQIAKKFIPLNQIFIEPDKKNTALAIYYTINQFSNLNQDTIISFLPSDHFISPISKFKKDILRAGELALNHSSLVTIGIHPSSPNPSFGYILKNKKFIEKPNKIQALKYVINGAMWNSGIYTATIQTYLSEFKNYFPNPNYKKSTPLSFDVAISEKSKNIDCIKASFGWSDVGEWNSIYKQSPKKNSFATVNNDTNYLQVNSRKCLISGPKDKLIGLVGVNNLAIIDTPRSLLVCNIAYDDSYHVRDLVTKIVNNPKLKHFFVDDEK